MNQGWPVFIATQISQAKAGLPLTATRTLYCFSKKISWVLLISDKNLDAFAEALACSAGTWVGAREDRLWLEDSTTCLNHVAWTVSLTFIIWYGLDNEIHEEINGVVLDILSNLYFFAHRKLIYKGF